MTSVPEITSTIIDFSTTALGSSYPEAYAQILDNVFNAEECAALLQIAENSNSGAWESAGIGPRQSVVTEVRHSDRILCDDPDIAGIIFDRIHQLIPPEILCIEPCGKYSGIIPGQYHKFTWNAKRLNERLRFLRYHPGMYFKEHCDGMYIDPTSKAISLVTLHLYLNDGMEGGSTSFFLPNFGDKFLDIEPKMGRVLLFQQRNLIHSGEEVTSGIKFSMRTEIMFEKN